MARAVGAAVLVALSVAAAQSSPRYTLSVSMAGGRRADLILWPDQEPADAVEAMIFDHLAGDRSRDEARASMLDHLCARFACERRSGRPVLFPLDLTLPGSGRNARLHVHEGDGADVAAFAARSAARHGFAGLPLAYEVERVIAGELARRADARWTSDDPYVVLGVSRDADGAAVKRAFRAESLRYHPDKPTADERRFLKIAGAYEILGDPKRRAAHDAPAPRPAPRPRRHFVVPEHLFAAGQVLFFQFS